MYTVFPTWAAPELRGSEPGGQYVANSLLREGVVTRLIEPEDKRSQSRRFIEYDVFVQHRDGEAGVGMTYANCVAWNPLCGLADSARFTLRPATSSKGKDAPTDGSRVLLLCVGGEQVNALIVGGLPDDRSTDEGAIKELGHHLLAEFNGCRFTVKGDGSFELLRRGPTSETGEPDGEAAKKAGQRLSFLPDGSAELVSAAGSEMVQLNHPDGTVVTKAPNGTRVGKATDRNLLGETFRKALKDLHGSVARNLRTAALSLATGQAAAQSMQVAHMVPVVGPILGAPSMGKLAATLQDVAQALISIAAAIDGFERADYLSSKNLSD